MTVLGCDGRAADMPRPGRFCPPFLPAPPPPCGAGSPRRPTPLGRQAAILGRGVPSGRPASDRSAAACGRSTTCPASPSSARGRSDLTGGTAPAGPWIAIDAGAAPRDSREEPPSKTCPESTTSGEHPFGSTLDPPTQRPRTGCFAHHRGDPAVFRPSVLRDEPRRSGRRGAALRRLSPYRGSSMSPASPRLLRDAADATDVRFAARPGKSDTTIGRDRERRVL